MKTWMKLSFTILLMLVFSFAMTGIVHAVTNYPHLYSDLGTIPIGKNTGSTQQYSSHWEYWSQGASGNTYMRDNGGCRVVAQAKLLVEAGIAPDDTSVFNPDTFFEWAVSKGYQGSTVYEYAPLGQAVTKYANEHGIDGSLTVVSLSGGNNATNDAIIMQYLYDGYFCYLYRGSHVAYVLRSYSIQQGTAVISNSSGSYTIFEQIQGYNGYGGETFTELYCYKFPGLPTGLGANLGDDFYAVILNKACWKPISQVEGTNRIYLESEDGSSRQVWRFQRQDDGAYVISSCYDGNILEMTSGIREVCTQVTAPNNNFWGGAYQQWYLYPYGGGYIIQSKHYPDEKWVMDLHGAISDDGSVIQINNRNDSPAQIWAIYKGEDVQLKGPVLTVTPGNSNTPTRFSWTRSYGVSTYNVRIFKDVLYDGEDYSQWGIDWQGSCTCETVLPAGRYVAYVDACNYSHWKASDEVVWFDVEPSSSVPIFGTPDFTLPSSIKEIASSAFEGVMASVIYVPNTCTSIGAGAFRNCPNLTQIRIPANCAIGADAFIGCSEVVIFGTRGSAAEIYANNHANCTFVEE